MKMMFPRVAVLAATAALSTAANATGGYFTICEACNPFSPTSAAVLSAAVTLAQQNSAAVGDAIYVCKDVSPGSSKFFWYSVNSAPVTGSSNLTYEDVYIEEGLTCAQDY